MDIAVIVEPDPKNGFQARTGEPLCLSAKGTRRTAALKKLEKLVRQKLRNGTQIVTLRVGGEAETNPWIKFAGMFTGDPMFGPCQKAIEEYRREVDEDPSR
jgi:hypothetical protein